MASVHLGPSEFLYGAMVGVTRQIDNLRGRRQDRFGAVKADAWRMHIEGACGELAVAKHLGVYWSGSLGNLKAPDVDGLQVRTRSQDDYDLIVHPPDKDAPGDRFVLVTGTAPDFRVRGWCFGHEAQQEAYWREVVTGRPAFFVPSVELHPIETLREGW